MSKKIGVGITCGALVLLVVVCLAFFYLLPYSHGRSRAQSDLKYQSFSFPEGSGHSPASTFSEGVAHLYLGYPEDDWVDGTRLSRRYMDCWVSGYKAVVEEAGYTVRRTQERPTTLGMRNSEQIDAAPSGTDR